MSVFRAKRVHTGRLVLSVLLGGLCLLALGAVPGQRMQAAAAVPSAAGQVDADPMLYLPFVAHNYGLLANGDFRNGLLAWNTAQGPFQGSGSGLPVSVVDFPLGNLALLGVPGATNGSIPVGYGTLYQTFVVQQRYLRLQYWVLSYDIAYNNGNYYDTFEVSVNRPPDQVTHSQRDNKGCTGSNLNPTGTLSVSGSGLVFCGGRPGASGGIIWDTDGWKTVTLDLNAFKGQWVTVYFTIWSREYVSPNIHNQAYYNTWAYVDNVQARSSASMASEPIPDPVPSLKPADTEETRFPWGVEGFGPPR
jgi:hypothetical protein